MQCFMYLVISFTSLYVVACDINPQRLVTIIAGIYIADIFFVHADVAFHHICIIVLVALCGEITSDMTNVITPTMMPYFRVLVAMEIPSIFSNTRRMMDIAEVRAIDGFIYKIHRRTNTTSMIRRINGVLFIATFFKFRIVDMYQMLIANPVMYADINRIILATTTTTTTNTPVAYFLFIGSIYGLFSLNVYWACLIVKNVYSDFAEAGWIVDSARTCEFLTQYTYIANVCFAIYAYQYSVISDDLFTWQSICLMYTDLAGILTAGLASYRFHRSCYEGILVEGSNDFNMASTAKRRNAFASDNGAMKIRSSLCVFAKMLAVPVYRISVRNKLTFVGLSAMVNMVTYLFAMKEWFTPNLFRRHELFVVFYSEKDKSTKERKRYISILNGVGITLDTLLTALFVTDVRILAFHYTVSLVVILLNVLQPFGKMNHFWLHCALALQIISCCRVNIESALIK